MRGTRRADAAKAAAALHDTAVSALAAFQAGFVPAARAAWEQIRARGSEGKDPDWTYPPGKGPPGPWGKALRTMELAQGVTAIATEKQAGLRIGDAAAKKMLSEDLREARIVRASTYLYYDVTRLHLVWAERPEWAAVNGLSLEWVLEALKPRIKRSKKATKVTKAVPKKAKS